jgi:type IV fimbrial biogenesis protein FimT
MRRMKHQRGVTLLELMIALTVVTILIGVAVPNYRTFTQNNRTTAAQNDLVTALNLARSESLRRSRPVTVCPSADGLACAGDTNWNVGWIVFTDLPGGTNGTVDGGDEILQRWDAIDRTVTLAVSDTFVRYLPTGEAAAPLTVDITPERCGGQNRRHLQITGTGSLLTQLTDCP